MNLHDAIDKDIFEIDNSQFTDADFQKMSADELETIRLRISKKVNSLSDAIAEKKIDYANGGKGSSKKWYLSQRGTLSENQRVLTYVNSLIKKRHRMDRTIGDYFMNQAKSVMPHKDFEHILSNAHQEMETAQKTNDAENNPLLKEARK